MNKTIQKKLLVLYFCLLNFLLTFIPFSFSYALVPAENITKLVRNIDDRDIDNEDRIPLILIHGIKGTSLLNFPFIDGNGTKEKEYFQNFINYFYEQNLHKNYHLYRFHYLSNQYSVQNIAQALQIKLDTFILNNAIADTKFVIVAHSMGGLIARSYMEEHKHNEGNFSGLYCGERVIRLITLATPHHGSPAANDKARANYYIDPDLKAVLNLNDVIYWWKTDQDCITSLFNFLKSTSLLSSFGNIFNICQNCQVQITDPNRSDLSWDNYNNLPQFQAEKNNWLDSLNRNNIYNNKVFSYYGTIDPYDPFYSYLMKLDPFTLLSVFARSFSTSPTFSFDDKYIPAEYSPSGFPIPFDIHSQLLISAAMLKKSYGLENDGVVPIDSGCIAQQTVGKKIHFKGYDHTQMRSDRVLSPILFSNIKNDLLSIFPTRSVLHDVANDINPSNISFSWSKSDCDYCDNISYCLIIQKDDQAFFNSEDYETTPLKRTSYPLPISLDDNTTYKWTVYPISENGIKNTDVDWHTFETGEKKSNSEPVAFFYVSPDEGFVTTRFNVNASDSYDIDNDPLTYTWNWGDGSSNFTPSTKATATHQYNQPGNYIISLTVSDDKGAKKQSSTVIIVREIQTPNQLPAVWIENTNLSDDQIELTFDASDSDGNIVGFYRTIGSKSLIDGNSPNESFFSTSTQYNQSSLPDGTHTFYVRAKDNDSGLSPIVSRSFTIESPVYSETSAKINRIDPTTIKANPGEIIPIAISYKNNSNVDWKSDPGQAHYIELRSVDKNGNQANGFLYDSSWISQTRVCSFNAANVAAATQENAWFLFSGKMPENVFTGSRDIYFKLYNPEKGFFGEITQIAVENKKSEIGSSGNLDYDWNFRDGTGGWRTRIAESEGIYNNEYWIIDPEVDPITGGGIIIDSEMISFHTDQYDEIEVRAGIEHTSLSYLEVHIKMNGVFKPPIKLYHVSGQQIANSQCVFKGNIGYSGQVDCVRIDFVKGLPSNDDRVFIDYVRFNATKAQTQTQPFGNLTVSYNDNDDLFYLQYALNEHSDKLIIYYSFNYGADWKVAHELDNISNYFKSGMLSKNIQDSKNYSSIDFKLLVINSSNNMTYTSEIEKLYYIPKPDYQEKSSEYPVSPNLYRLGSRSEDDEVTLQWKKIVDSKNNDNVNYYEIDYADNDSFSGNNRLNIGNPSKEPDIYETLTYTIFALQDEKTYFFRIRGVNSLGTGNWSNIRSTRIDIQDWPYFDTSYQEPVDGASNVSKLPVLRWRAFDADGDELDYKVLLGESPDQLYILRNFKRDKEKNWFDFTEEIYETLKPNTTYYWQVFVKDDRFFYEDEEVIYTQSPIWMFRTVDKGSDISLINVYPVGEILPNSEVIFQVTVKNNGSETSKRNTINPYYEKNETESRFYYSRAYIPELNPGQTKALTLTVNFIDFLYECYDITYDNILVSGDSNILFKLKYKDDQDINKENNSYIYHVNYVDNSPPEIEYFDLDEVGRMYADWSEKFWARMGKDLKIVVFSKDNTMVTHCEIMYRYHQNDEWVFLADKIHGYTSQEFNFTHSWNLPTDILPTDEAQIKILLYDNEDNLTTKTSDIFSIYSNQIDISIIPNKEQYKVGETIEFQIVDNSYNLMKDVEISFLPEFKRVLDEFYTDGKNLTGNYSWDIPSNNSYASKYAKLVIEVKDTYSNKKTVESDQFIVNADTELPYPFNESIILYENEFVYPDGATSCSQKQTIEFIRLDQNNIVHAVVQDMHEYYLDTEENEEEDTSVYYYKYYYLTYNPNTSQISSKIKICDEELKIIDFELIESTPFVLLASRENFSQIYFSYKNENNYFQEPVAIENEIISKISNITVKDANTHALNNCFRYIYHNGYIYKLDFNQTLTRYSFSQGTIGQPEEINVQGNFESIWIEPVSDNNFIYFISSLDSKLVCINTNNFSIKSYSLPFDLGYDDEKSFQTSLISYNNIPYIFAVGKVFTVINNEVKELSTIQYTFDNETVDISTFWEDKVSFSKAILDKETNTIWLLIGYSSSLSNAKPERTRTEILIFNTTNYSFSKNVVKTKSNSRINSIFFPEHGDINPDLFDTLYIGNNKVLISISFQMDYYFPVYQYYSGINLLDLNTANIMYLGKTNIKSENSFFFSDEQGKFYIIGSDQSSNMNCSQISFNNFNTPQNQLRDIKFLKKNNELYVSWYDGAPYDGRWDFQNQKIKYYLNRKNMFRKVYPLLGEIDSFSSEPLGYGLNVHNNYLSATDEGLIGTLKNDFTLETILIDNDCCYNIFKHKSFDSNYIGGINSFNFNSSTRIDVKLYKEDLSYTDFQLFSSSNVIATFKDEILCVGYGYEPYYGKYVVSKFTILDNSLGVGDIISFGKANSDFNINRSDINQNKYVATAWKNFLAVADLSGDIVQPQINFTSDTSQIKKNETTTLSWQALDNKDELIKYELYTIINNNQTLLETITDTTKTSYSYTFTQANNTEVTFKIVAYDKDNNWNSDSITFTVISPVTLTSFIVNKSTVLLGDKLIFTWESQDADFSTPYTVCKRKTGVEEWETYFIVDGDTSKVVEIEGFVGEHEFKIQSPDDSLLLSNTVNIEGDLPEFDLSGFSPQNIVYYVQEPVIDFTWQQVKEFDNPLRFSLYIKPDGAEDYTKVTETFDHDFHYEMSEMPSFHWKIKTNFRNQDFVSSAFQVTMTKLQSPDINSLTLNNHHTDQPSVQLCFDPVDNITKYVIARMSSSSSYTEMAITSELCYTDADITYGEYYTYAVISKKGDLIADPGNFKITFVSIREIESITIETANYLFLDGNSLTLNYYPNDNNSYEKYEICLGTSPENLNTYTKTTRRSAFLEKLDYGATYYCDVYALNNSNERLANTKASTVFTTAPEPIPQTPTLLEAIPYTTHVELKWSVNSDHESDFVIERKLKNDELFSQVHITSTFSYTDTHIYGKRTYIYRVCAMNSSGMSGFSNEITVTTQNRAPRIVSTPSYQIEQDALYTYTILTENIDNEILSFSALKKPADMIIHPTKGKVLWKPMDSDVGSHEISVKVSDGEIDTLQHFTLDVLNINDAPEATNLTFTCYEDLVLHTILSGKDIDNDILAYQLIETPVHGEITINGNMLTYTPVLNYFGSEHLTYQITDGQLYSDIADLTIEVLPLNDPPIVEHEISDIFVDEDRSITPIELTYVFSDIDNSYTELTWTVTDQSALSITISNNIATITISDENWYGNETIIFTATDPNGLAASESVSISLKQNLPIFSGLPIIIRVQKPYPDWNGYVTVAFSATDENKYTDYGSKTFTVNNMGYYTSANLNDILSGYDTAYSEITWTSVGQNQLTVSIDSNNVANIQIPDSAWSGYETITLTTAGTNSLTDLDYEKISVTPLDDIMEESDLTLIIQILKLIDQ